MDADNRVVLNCGGIRHEVYKVDDEKLMNLIYMYVCCRPLDPLGQKIEIKRLYFPLTKKLHNVFSLKMIYFILLLETRSVPKKLILIIFLLTSGHFEENPRHSPVEADRGPRQL